MGLTSIKVGNPISSANMPAEQLISICGQMPLTVLTKAGSNDACWLDQPESDAFVPVQRALRSETSRLTLAKLNQALASSQSAREFRCWMAQAQRHAASEEMPLLLAFQRYFDRLAISS